jgi:subtilisin family serine protease
VIDTGIAKAHPDLNVAGGYDCTSTYRARYGDADGHGTHVAGIIGATNTGSGVVGVAPGTPLYGVRVFDAKGYGSDATVICGIDWVVKNAAAKGIKVANMSVVLTASPEDQNRCGSTGTPTTALHEAICRLTAAGVKVVAAAGNVGKNASTLAPATYPEVVTVSALDDSNGCLGESGGAETRATFSNYGADVDVAAPGVNIASTYLRGGYTTISGTSMAAPHVAGTIARNVKRLGRATWAEETSGTLPEGIVKVSAATSCG